MTTSHDTHTAPRWVAPAEQAKMIRAALKAAFPGVKFSVRSQRGCSISVRWVDGPTHSSVDTIARRFAGGSFDGMTDLRTSHTTLITTDDGAELVRFGADFVICQRDTSDEWRAEIVAEIARVAGVELDFDRDVWTKRVAVFVERETGRILPIAGSSEYVSTILHQHTSSRAR